MLDKLSLFEDLINNPLTRIVLKGLTGYCEICGENRLEVALELFIGLRKDACVRCKLAERAISVVLKSGARSFNVTTEEIKEKFRDAHWRKGLASVIKGLAVFGARRPFVPGAPFQVVWDITYACNLRCKHCYATAGKALPDELTTAEALDIIDRLDRFGVTIIAFSGGEPLVRKDILRLSRYASDRGIYVAIATNGTLITRDMARRMKDAGIEYVQISLDGMRETHDAFRGIKGAFDRTIGGIKNCVDEDFFVNVSMTVTKRNYSEVPQVIDLCEELGVDWFMHFNFIPTGRGKRIIEDDITPKEREELLKMLYLRNKKGSGMSLLSTAPQFSRVALQCDATMIPTHFYNIEAGGKLRKLAEFIGGCGAGRFYIAIRANGDITPCVFFPLKVANIRDGNLEELWMDSKVFNDLRNKDIIEECGCCDFRYYCGGCRARAYNYFGDYLAPDPGCVRNIKYHEMLLHRI